MPSPKKPYNKLCKSAKWYRDNPDGRKQKAATDKKINARPEQKKKRRELAKARRKRGIMGNGQHDLHHTKSGKLVAMSPSKNRGMREKSRKKGSKRK